MDNIERLSLIKEKLSILPLNDKVELYLAEMDMIEKLYLSIMGEGYGQLMVDSYCEDAESFLVSVMH